MIIDAITSTGSRYRIDLDRKFWSKIDKYGNRHQTESIWELKIGTELKWPWDAPDSWEFATQPEIGKHLFLASKDVWWASTPIVEILEVDDWMQSVDTDPVPVV